MSCFSEQFCIELVILFALIMIIRLVVPALLNFFGLGGVVAQVISIILWAIITIVGIKILWVLFSCLWSSMGASGMKF
jgi:hypothetical protein